MNSLYNVNKVILVGNIGANPEIRYTKNGKQVTNLAIATNRNRKNQAGEFEESTEWHRAVVWGKRADLCVQFLRKGNRVYVEGMLETRQWENSQGQRQFSTEITVEDIKFLGYAEKSA